MRTRFILIVPALFIVSMLWSQETLINVPFTQPVKLQLDAGEDQVLPGGQTMILGNDLIIKGGTPDFLYCWTDINRNTYISPTLTISSPGTYYLTITDGNNCTASDSVSVSGITALNYQLGHSALSVFPNPSAGMFHFKLVDAESYVRLEVVTAEGKMVFEHVFDTAQQMLSGTIDLTGFDRGIYYIKVMTGKKMFVRSIIIQ